MPSARLQLVSHSALVARYASVPPSYASFVRPCSPARILSPSALPLLCLPSQIATGLTPSRSQPRLSARLTPDSFTYNE